MLTASVVVAWAILRGITGVPDVVENDRRLARIASDLRSLQLRWQLLVRPDYYSVTPARGMVHIPDDLPTSQSISERLLALECEMAARLEVLDKTGIAWQYSASQMYHSVLRSSPSPGATRSVFGKMASLGGGSALWSHDAAQAWLAEARGMANEDGLRPLLANGRHLAPWSAAVRAYLVDVLLFNRDEACRHAAMIGLQNTFMDADVAWAMNYLSKGAGSVRMRKQALAWLDRAKEAGVIK